jgi:DNA-directed RNA polymerase specialized sigma24 family protein
MLPNQLTVDAPQDTASEATSSASTTARKRASRALQRLRELLPLEELR